ncbi:MAG: hypothetical protein KF708_07770 [Pirellulales bacterium]|nr:hypothetical protein [Pirellulales bacterium]
MNTREAIGASVSLSPIPARRIDAAEKARQLVTERPAVTPPPATTPKLAAAPMNTSAKSGEGNRTKKQTKPLARLSKLTTRVYPEQLEWLKLEVSRYREQNPRAPRITVEELTRVALEHLRETGNLETLIAKYRG